MNKKFDFDDILIEPAIVSSIESRSNVNICDSNGFLPIFTAPMDTVVSDKNYSLFNKQKIYSIIPRKGEYIFDEEKYSTHKNNWIALGLNQFVDFYINKSLNMMQKHYVLIDIANGNMSTLVDVVKTAKKMYGDNLVLMVGNVANPYTYKNLSDAGANMIRVGIGNGAGCLTTENTGIGYPMGSLINECYKISLDLENPAKIVADGGMKKYSDIIKAIALGADYCMLGGIFNKSLESAGDTFSENKRKGDFLEPGEQIDQYSDEIKMMFKSGAKYFKKFRGMSSKDVQKKLGNKILKTSEGITRINPVEYTIEGWVENFSHYLSSAMSYTGCNKLDEFRGQVTYNFITQNALNRFTK